MRKVVTEHDNGRLNAAEQVDQIVVDLAQFQIPVLRFFVDGSELFVGITAPSILFSRVLYGRTRKEYHRPFLSWTSRSLIPKSVKTMIVSAR
jgi:hypothetical protein